MVLYIKYIHIQFLTRVNKIIKCSYEIRYKSNDKNSKTKCHCDIIMFTSV